MDGHIAVGQLRFINTPLILSRRMKFPESMYSYLLVRHESFDRRTSLSTILDNGRDRAFLHDLLLLIYLNNKLVLPRGVLSLLTVLSLDRFVQMEETTNFGLKDVSQTAASRKG